MPQDIPPIRSDGGNTDSRACVPAPSSAICIHCGYQLRALTRAVCPECGKAFDPGDPLTFNDAAHPPTWWQASGPPRWWHLAGMLVLLFVGLYHFSEPLGSLLVCLAFPLMLLLGTDYAVRLLDMVRRRRRGSQTPLSGPAERSAVRWLVTPFCFAVLCSMAFTWWPLHVRFALSRGAMEQAVRRMQATGPRFGQSMWIGLFHIKRVAEIEPGVLSLDCYGDPIGGSGFVYRPAGPPADGHGRRDLGNAWYFESR
jgi:hypothetical protein